MTDEQILKRLTGDMKRIAELVGVENMFKLSREFGGLVIFIPKLDAFEREMRDVIIRREYDCGKTVRDLAKKYDLTVRQIYYILKKSDDIPSDTALPLFMRSLR